MYEFRGFYVPQHMEAALRAYLVDGEPPGQFLTAVLKNDLFNACGHADEENLRNLPAFMGYLYNEAPAPSWGSPEKFAAWLGSFTEDRAPVTLNSGAAQTGLPREEDFGPGRLRCVTESQ
jgi:hypothetical protein